MDCCLCPINFPNSKMLGSILAWATRLFRGREAMDIHDYQQSRNYDWPNVLDGSEILRLLLHQFGNGGLHFLDPMFHELDLTFRGNHHAGLTETFGHIDTSQRHCNTFQSEMLEEGLSPENHEPATASMAICSIFHNLLIHSASRSWGNSLRYKAKPSTEHLSSLFFQEFTIIQNLTEIKQNLN